MTNHAYNALIVLALPAVLAVGCSSAEEDETRPDRLRPLQPLVYTEDPNLSPEAAAVRERRLMRRLLEGANSEGATWGTLEGDSGRQLPPPATAQELGETIYRALVDQSDRHWDHLFVSPRAYAALVQVKMKQAQKFVDNQQADAHAARQAFAVETASERPKAGLSSIFKFERLKLGDGRQIDGSIADEDELVVQHWDNQLHLTLAETGTELRLRIPKILRVQQRGRNKPAVRLGVASDIEIGPRLEAFLAAGMHLKSELLRSFEYPLPLSVGNFWRYRRHLRGKPLEDDSSSLGNQEHPATPPPEELPEGLTASEVMVEVKSVDRYDTRRLVRLERSYNDADLTRRTEHWLVTPRRIYTCPRPCRRHIEDLEWLLGYLRRQTAIYQFPLARGDDWGDTFTVDEQWHEIHTPAGTFFGTLAVRGLGPLAGRVPAHQLRDATRFIAPGKGVVKRTYRIGPNENDTIVETLLDYRLMPR